ncbi:MAG: hypothetical protein KF753_23430 [Caldilineaceae bacterium]|nr:hypothetical protein [Caldilineaceae bacterium]
MSDETRPCGALTKAGTPCKNNAVDGSNYCHVHRNYQPAITPQTPPATPPSAAPPPAAPPPTSPVSGMDREEFRQLVADLNALAEQLRAVDARFTPPDLTLEGLGKLLQENIYRFTPQAQREIIDTLRSSFAGTTRADLVNPETWKGFWFVLNYMAQNQRQETMEKLNRQLERIPGFALLGDLAAGLQDAKPSDFLEPDTWKGLYYILDYSAKTQIEQMKQRILGQDEE